MGGGTSRRFAPANTTYYLNYDTEINHSVHWLDDIDDGEFIEFYPPDPVRVGYQFSGWFIEPEAINEWIFAKDTVIDSQQLFAKWITI
jgi:hypothetical protein